MSMSMARMASQALNYYQRSSSITLLRILPQHHRHISGKATAEVDSDESLTEEDSISIAKKLDEAVQTFVIRRAAPDWLPFVPGASYWVPPPDLNNPCKSIIQILDMLPRTRRRLSSSEDETSYSSPYGSAQAGHMPLSVEVDQVVMLDPETGATDSDDEC